MDWPLWRPRPWTLLAGEPTTPTLAFLGLPYKKLVEVYSTSRTTTTAAGHATAAGHESATMENMVAWETTWDAYVRGHVVSDTAARFIQSFLLKTVAATGSTMENQESYIRKDMNKQMPRRARWRRDINKQMTRPSIR